jgi:hypothetical protein
MKLSGSTFTALAGIGLVLGLSACGGYSAVEVGGSVFGLTTDGLVLENGGSTVAIPANATSYTFPSQIGNYDTYNVTIKAQPARLTCSVPNGAGTATGVSITWATVVCAPNTFTIGGTVDNLTTSGLVLTNGSDKLPVAANSTGFTFTQKVADGSVYGVAVLTQPAGQTCTVSKGTGTMGNGAVSNIEVICR